MNERYDDKVHVPDMASNSTGRVAASQPGEPGKARCPNCGNTKLGMNILIRGGLEINCRKCSYNFFPCSIENFAQFFRPSAPSPHLAGAASHNGQGWVRVEVLEAIEGLVGDDFCEELSMCRRLRGRIATAHNKLSRIYRLAHSFNMNHSCHRVHENWRDELKEYSEPLPAPPSEANGPQAKENK